MARRTAEASLTGAAKRRKEEDDDDDFSFPAAYDEMKKPADEEGFLCHPQEISAELTGKPLALLVRASYGKLYHQIRRGRASFVHVSGNPGTGKSCCIWYFLHQLLNDEEASKCYIIVQLVAVEQVSFLVISPDGQVTSSIRAPRQLLRKNGAWLLVDQRFTGIRAARGITVLFASPSQHNGAVEAVKIMDESRFTTFYLDAWKPSELLKVFNRRYRHDLGSEVLTRTGYQTNAHPPGHFGCKAGGYSAAAHFLARMYICGGIARYFFEDLETVMHRQVSAVSTFIQTGTQGEEPRGVNDGSKPHKVFYTRPDYCLRKVVDVVLVSPFIRKVYVAKAFAATLKDREKFSNLAKYDSKYASPAGDIFEDYAHLLLSSRGGTYEDINDESSTVTFKPRARNTFYGNKFKHKAGMFDIALSSSFGIVDSASPEDGTLMQMSRAKSQSLMGKAEFEQLVELCRKEMKGGPGGACIKGVPANTPVFVHVRPHDTGPVKEVGLRDSVVDGDGKPVMTPKGNQRWKKASLPIPQLAIRLPPMDEVALAPVYEELVMEVLDFANKAVQEGEELFEEEPCSVCEECGEVDGDADGDDYCQCLQCEGWLHKACMPNGGNGLCLTCCLVA